jgi:hypothetical protein
MQRNLRFALGALALCTLATASLACDAIIGLQAPPDQDATATGSGSGDDAGDSTTGSTGGDAGSDSANPSGAMNGAACTVDTACQSGHCADGVCCNTACAGTCEACNLGPSKGKCSPIPVGTDPEMECVAVPTDGGVPPDASGVVAPSNVSGVEAGAPTGDAGAVSGDAASADAGGGFDGSPQTINFPDSGYMSSDKTCAGTCDGKGGNGGGSCVFPDTTKTCGTQFCNTHREAAGFACNGAGACTLGFKECSRYSCVAGACGSTCTKQLDCLEGFYCDAPSNTCKPTLGNGLNCTSNSQCSSGFCTTGPGATGSGLSPVCCSTDCMIPGGSCVQAGSVGECKCMVSCPTGGSCQVYYQDADGDMYGNKNGDPNGGVTAYVGCSNVAPRAGYVADNTDCDDQDPNAHPGQTMYFGTPGRVNFDYDCDGMQEKQTPEFPGASCEFCSPTPTCAPTATMCSATGQQSTFKCGPRIECVGPPVNCRPPLLCICRIGLGGCWPLVDTGFPYAVDCGMKGNTTTCGTCTGPGLTPATTTTLGVQQLCH